MIKDEKQFGLRINGDLLAKFRYVSGHFGRSANSQIIQLITKIVDDYEKKHGLIKKEDLKAYKKEK